MKLSHAKVSIGRGGIRRLRAAIGGGIPAYAGMTGMGDTETTRRVARGDDDSGAWL